MTQGISGGVNLPSGNDPRVIPSQNNRNRLNLGGDNDSSDLLNFTLSGNSVFPTGSGSNDKRTEASQSLHLIPATRS